MYLAAMIAFAGAAQEVVPSDFWLPPEQQAGRGCRRVAPKSEPFPGMVGRETVRLRIPT